MSASIRCFGPEIALCSRPGPSVHSRTDSRLGVVHAIQMRGQALTPKQLSSVPCPTCGVAAGMRCERYTGVPRKVPHVDRKFAAVEAVTNGKAKRRS